MKRLPIFAVVLISISSCATVNQQEPAVSPPAANPPVSDCAKNTWCWDNLVMGKVIYWLAKKYYAFLYRHEDDDVCCCGDWMGKHSYFDNHMPRSMKEYAITSSADRWKP